MELLRATKKSGQGRGGDEKEEQESGQPKRGVTGLRGRERGGEGQLVMLAAGQAAYKIHKISALKSAAGQKLKT